MDERRAFELERVERAYKIWHPYIQYFRGKNDALAFDGNAVNSVWYDIDRVIISCRILLGGRVPDDHRALRLLGRLQQDVNRGIRSYELFLSALSVTLETHYELESADE